MAGYQDYLAILDSDPRNDQALLGLAELGGTVLNNPDVTRALEEVRKALRERGEIEVVARLFDIELHAAESDARRADLLLAKGHLYAEDFLSDDQAVACFTRVLEIRPDDEDAQEVLANMDLVRQNWQKIVAKYLEEARVATDRQLCTSLYLSAAETCARYQPDAPEVEQHLRKALEVDPRNRRAARHLERMLRSRERWDELAALLDERVDAAATKDERVQALLGLAELARDRLGRPELAVDAMKKVAATDPAHPAALRVLADEYEREDNWSSLVMLYTNALKARRRSSGREPETGMLLQIAMLHWRRLDNADAAEEYFRRIRKAEPAHPAALDFYRDYYPARGEVAKLLQVLRQAHKAVDDEATRRRLSVEIAELAEGELGNPEKAIDAWKAILRAEPGNDDAREALKRLYRRTEKWNALLDLMKDEIERLPADDAAGRIERLGAVVEIYRDKLKLDVMVINTYNSILQIDPAHVPSLDALAAKYKELGRWNDLIAVLARKAELEATPRGQRVELLREIAGLWSDRFGNYAQAVKPLEDLLDLEPGDVDARARLKEIYTKRRQWRALIALMGRELAQLPGAERRAHLIDMAQLASDRLGDPGLAIAVWNQVLELHEDQTDPEALGALASLYERAKRWMELAEVCHRHRAHLARTGGDPRAAVAVLERLGQLYADRLQAPAQAAAVFREVLALDPDNARALRTLRELYAATGDHDALIDLYGGLGLWEDLVEVLSALADRIDDRARQLALLERTAAIAAEHLPDNPDKVSRAYERVQAVAPTHAGAAQALVPLYTKTEKWARLLATYEILLAHATEDSDRLNLHVDIRDLCEVRLGSKALAFAWTCKAYALKPDSEQLLDDVMRLGAEADQWDEVAATLQRRAESDGVDADEKLRLLRELGAIAATRLHQPDDARRYQEAVLELAPDDPQAMDALEKLASEQSRWPDLIKIYRRRAALAGSAQAKLDLLFKVAYIEEDRVGDLDAAAATYQEILGIDGSSQRALKSLRKVQEERGDSAGLAAALERELALLVDAESIVGLLLRLGGLYEDKLGRRADALAGYKRALDLQPKRRDVHAALERFLTPAGDGDRSHEEVAALLLPVFESQDDSANVARCVEILRGAADDAQRRLAYDRRLVKLYGLRLDDPRRAFDAGLRVLDRAPEDADNRRQLLEVAAELDVFGDLASALERVLVPDDGRELDASARRSLSIEVAQIYDERLQQHDQAESAWRRVLALDPACGPAYDALDRLLRGAERWAELRDLLLSRESNTLDGGKRRDILLSICDLDEGVLDDADGAIASYVRVLQLDPQMPRAYKALERLYAAKQAWAELEALLARQADHLPASDRRDATRADLAFRRAILRANQLDDAAGSVDLLEELVAARPGYTDARELLEELLRNTDQRLRVARILEPLYEADGLWRDLCVVLRAQRELASAHEALELLVRVARIEEEQIANERAAFDTYVDAMALAPADERPRRALQRLAPAQSRWTDAAIAWEDAVAAAPEHDLALRGALLRELAEIYDDRLGDADSAITAYARLLEVDPGNAELSIDAARALDRLYTAAGKWAELIDIIRRQTDWVEGTVDRKGSFARIARLYEDQLGDADSAIAAWRDVLTEDPDDGEALDALERAYTERKQARDLIDILRRRVEIAGDAAAKKDLLRRIAGLWERDAEEPSEAIAAHLEVLDHVPDDRDTLAELARLYRAGERWVDLLDITERRYAHAADDGERVAFGFEIGDLLSTRLDRETDALERFGDVLRRRPDHGDARAAVEALFEDGVLRGRCAEVLRPIYERGGEHAALASMLAELARAADDPRERVALMREVAALREHQLGDPAGAFDARASIVREALAEPDLAVLIGHLERLAAALHREKELIDIYRDIAPEVLDADLQRRLYLDIADLSRAVLKDVDVAREYYGRVIEAQPDDARATAALEGIYREAQDYAQLYELLIRKADLNEDDLDVRAGALAEAASLCGEQLARPEDAIMHWEQVLDVVPHHVDAFDALEQLYEDAERWHDLADVLGRRLGFAFKVKDAVELQFRLGGIYEKRLLDSERAVEAYAAALGGDANHEQATAALEAFLDDAGTRNAAAEVLEPIYVARQEWPKLVRIYEIKLDAAEDATQRTRLTRYIARLYEEQLEDLEEAFRWYGRVFRESPTDLSVCDQLNRLAIILQDWKGLTDVYQEYVDDEPGDGPELQAIALALADTYDRRMNEVDRALAAYRRVLRARPDDLDTFTRLESMLTRAERWYALVETYEQAIADTLDERRRVDLYGRVAHVQEQRLQDTDRAVEAYRAILDIDPDHATAGAELDRLYQAAGQWHELSDLLLARLSRTSDAPGKVDAAARLRLRIAEIAEHRLADLTTAIDLYETVLGGGAADTREDALHALERLVLDPEHRERIANLLEPVYRANDWWQKLVVILDAKLEYIDDPERRIAVLREIARLHESRRGDDKLALDALARAWKEDISDQEVYDELAVTAAKLGAWDRLIATLEEGIEGNYDFELVATVLARIAELQETRRSDLGRAIDAWRRVLEAREDDPAALAALDRLLGAESRHRERVEIIARRAELTDDPGQRIDFLVRIAALQEQELSAADDAIQTWRAVLAVDDSDGQALDALERLYRAAGDHTELGMILARKIELTTDPAARRALRFAAAAVYDDHLKDPYEAIAQLRAVLDDDPDDGQALARLDGLYKRETMWNELLEILDRRARLAPENGDDSRPELEFRAARLVERELLEPERAIERYAAVLDRAPGHAGAREALDALARNEDTLPSACAVLERVYRGEGAFDRVADLYERRLRANEAGDPAERLALFGQLAELREHSQGDPTAAFAVWARALADAPEDRAVQDELERLAASRGAWPELVDLYEERLGAIVDPELEYAYAIKLARLCEDALGNNERAAQQYRRALGVATDEREALAALDRIYEREQKYAELAEILEREAEATLQEDAQAELLYRLGDVRERQLGDAASAVGAYRDVLERQPGHAAARAALERLLSSDAERSEIIAILEPLYEADDDWGRLADLLGAKLGITSDSLDRAMLYQRIAELAERKLSDPVRALDAAGGWLAEDPSSPEALAELERLAGLVDRWGEVAARLQGIIESTDAPEIRQQLSVQLGEVQLDRLGDAKAATQTFRRVLKADREHPEALAALERIYRDAGDRGQLSEILARRGELAFDAQLKRTCFVEVATLREQMDDYDTAIGAWREVLEIDEGDREAHHHLAAIYERRQDWRALIDLLSLAARFAREPGEERALRTRIARIYGETLGELDHAVDAWQSVIDLDPDDLAALGALEEVQVRREDWLAVQEVLVRRLGAVGGDAERVEIYRKLASIAETRRESADEAISYLHQILDLDNADMQAYAELERLLGAAERWHDLVEVLQRVADVVGTLGDTAREVEYLARAADVWDGPLENAEAAGEILEKILQREPNYVPAFNRLARIYEAHEEWDRCAEVLQRALALGPTGRDAADLYYRLGEVERHQRDDVDAAANYFAQALQYEHTHGPSVAAVEAIAREREDWGVVADMLGRREATETDEAGKLEITLELAEIYSKRLGQPDAVIPLLQRAAQLAPDDPRVLGPLGDLYFAAGRYGEALPIYERLADEAKSKRRMKDVATYRQRVGSIAEATGQIEVARAAYEEAFRVNPTDVATMAGLGRLYMAAEDWEKARRVYRSMVLQTIEPDVGVTKAQVYYQLGQIHERLGEAPKAKGMYQRGLELEPNNAQLRAALDALA